MTLNWFSQLFPCLSVRSVHGSADVFDVTTETRSVSGRHVSGERRYVTERRPSVESQFSAQRDSFETRQSLESLPLEGPPPKGHEEALSWLDNGSDLGVIAARDAADRRIRKSLSSEASDRSYATAETASIQRDFDRDENGLPLFAVGSPGSAGPLTPNFPPAPPTKETASRRRGPFPRDSSSLDITRFDHSPPSSTVSSPSGGSRPDDWKHLDLPYTGAVWPLGVGYESFSERINALSLAAPKKNQVAEDDSCWKRGSVNSRRPVLHINTKFEAPVARPRAAFIESPSECGSRANDLPEPPTIVSPSDHGSHEDGSPTLTTVRALASEVRGSDDDRSSSDDGRADSPAKPFNDSGFGSMIGDSDSRPEVHLESPTTKSPTTKSPTTKSPTTKSPGIKSPALGSPAIDKLVNDDNINSDVPVDSPASSTKSASIEELIDDINGFIEGISTSHAIITSAPEVDKLADDSNGRSEVEKGYWDVVSDGVAFEAEGEDNSFESVEIKQATWTECGSRE